MELMGLVLAALGVLLLVILGRLFLRSLKFIFFLLLILLAAVFIFGISLSNLLDFIRNLVFFTF